MRNFCRILFYLVIFAGLLRIVAWQMCNKLPDKKQVSDLLMNDPVQTEVIEEPYDYIYQGEKVYVQPIANYELYGLIVSHNDINSIADIYYPSNSENFRDACVVWGSNIRTDVYREMNFVSNSFQCEASFKRGANWQNFNGAQLSNNHFLTQSEKIKDKILSLNVGDQIYVSGKLVNYKKHDWDGFRNTSLVRDDNGGGACEIIMVEQLRILKRGNVFWNFIKNISGYIFFFGLPAWLLLTVLNIWGDYNLRYARVINKYN